MNKILLVDNFDSFTFNLYQYLGELAETEVYRNDRIPFDRLENGDFSHVVISPGPGDPTDLNYFGGCSELIDKFKEELPILGICLGHQGIGAYFGGSISRASTIMHGKTSTFIHSGKGLFAELPNEVSVMRYHSLVVDADQFPVALIVDAKAEDGSIMAFHHKDLPVFGLQFHPESFKTETGKQMLANFVKEEK